jgi:putative peptidoglycan lipid II flippase
MQAWTLRRVGVRYRASLQVRHPGVVKVAKLMLPVLLGLSLPQLCTIITRPFASTLGDGPITWLDNANKVMQMPLGIFAQALSVAIFPTLSALAAQQDMPGLRRQFSLGLRSILFLTIPSAVLIMVLATPITGLLFQRGRWTAADTQATASAVIFYSIAIFAVSGQQIVNRGFYSMQNTWTPMLAGTAASLAFVLLNCVLVGLPLGRTQVPFAEQVQGANALALSYSLSMALYLGLLLWLFRKAAGGMNGAEIARSVARVLAAAAAMGAAAWGVRLAFEATLPAFGPEGMRAAAALAQIAAAAAAGGAVYLAAVRLLRVPEAEFVLATVRRRFSRG